MNYIAIDTSGKTLTVVLCKDDKIYSHHDTKCGLQHSTTLMPVIEKMANEIGFDFNSADFFACVVGAGSFTGIRIGVSTIKAFCFAYNKPCLSITSFDTIAYNSKSGKVLAVIDAKHNGFYVCGYDNLKVSIEPSYIMKEEVLALKNDYELLSFEEIKGLETKVVSSLDGLILAVQEKKGETSFDLESLSPLYVRKSQAEEGR